MAGQCANISVTMKKTSSIVTRSVSHFANVMGLAPINSHELKMRGKLSRKIIEVIKHKNLTHLQVARLAKTYPTTVTAILNRKTRDISTTLMLRILVSLGVRAKAQFKSIQ